MGSNEHNLIEILAPAGSVESMKAAFYAGADAVYMGGSRFGARAFADNPQEEDLKKAIDYALSNDKYLCAICAAPLILGQKEILKDKKATCYPGFESDLIGAEVTGGFVEADGKVITAKGAGVAIDFALKIVEKLKNKEAADKINASIQSK